MVEDASAGAYTATPRSTSSASLWLQPGGGNVKVVVRVRPDDGADGGLQVRGNSIKLLPQNKDYDGFSWVAGPGSTQTEMMARVGEPMVDSLRSGFNSTILAYGDSGSGKTHTMLGPPGPRSEAEEGLIPRVLKSLFGQLTEDYGPATADPSAAASVSTSVAQSGAASEGDDAASSCNGEAGGGGVGGCASGGAGRTTWCASLAFLQIYKQSEITNLLSSGYSTVGGGGMRLAPLLEAGQSKLPRDVFGFLRRRGAMLPVASADEALSRLQQGARLRCTSATINNADSSRSHAVLLLELTIRTPRPDGSWLEQRPRLVMMDLAGSESFESSTNTVETTAINTGLLHLGNVLRELADTAERGGGGGGGGALGRYVNFNNHNLTRLLEHSMDARGRGGRVALVVTLRPTPPERLHHSLLFAQKALRIRITAAKNEQLLARDMAQLVERLQGRVQELEIELQRWVDRHEAELEAARIQLEATFAEAASEADARHAAEAEVLRRRGDDAAAALDDARGHVAAAESEMERLRRDLDAARAEAVAAAAACAESEARARDEAAARAAAEGEAAALRSDVAQLQEAAGRAEAERRITDAAHAAALSRLRSRAVEEAAAASAAAMAAQAGALAGAEAAAAAALRQQAEALSSAHAAEVASLRAELAVARARADAAEAAHAAEVSRMRDAAADAAAVHAAALAELRATDRAAAEAAARELTALRHDSAVKRQRLLRAKAVVREVREGELARRGSWSDGGDGAEGGAKSSGQRPRASRRATSAFQDAEGTERGSSSGSEDGGGSCGSDGAGSASEAASLGGGDSAESSVDVPLLLHCTPPTSRRSVGSGGDQAARRPRRSGSGGSGVRLSMSPLSSPVRWLSQAVKSPESVRTTPAERQRMLRTLITHMRWEAVGLMSVQRGASSAGTNSPAASDCGGGGGTAGSDADSGAHDIDGAAHDTDGGADASHVGASRRLSKGAAAAALPLAPHISPLAKGEVGSGGAAAAANGARAEPQKRRRQLQPPQPSDTAAVRAAARAGGGRGRPPALRSGWPAVLEPEPEAERKAELDAAVLKDMRARAPGALERARGAAASPAADGAAPPPPPPARVTVEALVAALGGRALEGVEWRRGHKKRHELVLDYLAWAAAHPPPGPSADEPEPGLAPWGDHGRAAAAAGAEGRQQEHPAGADAEEAGGAPPPAATAGGEPSSPPHLAQQRGGEEAPPHQQQQQQVQERQRQQQQQHDHSQDNHHPQPAYPQQPPSPTTAALLAAYCAGSPPRPKLPAPRAAAGAHPDLYAAGSRSFCERQLPLGRR
ncbi:hypothetical protein Rsub_10454 [Raphidocelis subcapitata]|uniref:Kinesin motor domain-containing protein n=1 Tax=Raphidocelis subcapitata TaxID=307507 RepID=A0A2V0PCF6_9CHLO|nr:hypothetical protein Rsub_10454 [Raphidocelis subcapitata]|eukprot:GBF97531.1 hypothetical protein Rsub_10454 [Raphidocelis subcapitata]